MYEEQFSIRLSQLRLQKGVSARDMSLSLGQNPGYINNIETSKALPSMTMFFYICEYLKITPYDFFNFDNQNPKEINDVTEKIKHLTQRQLNNISEIIDDMIK